MKVHRCKSVGGREGVYRLVQLYVQVWRDGGASAGYDGERATCLSV